MNNFFFILSLFFILIFQSSYTQEISELRATYTDEKITLDGIDSELSWGKTQVINDDFYQIFPVPENKGSQKNEIKIIYDDKFLYIFAKASTKDGKASVTSLERDYQVPGTDAIFILLDTYSDSSNAFWFEANSVGVKKDALVSNGGLRFESDIDFSWDIKYEVETFIGEEFYNIEFKIPFSSLKFPEGSTKWKIQLYRADSANSEFSSWTKVPKGQNFSDLSFFGDLIFDKPLGSSKSPIILIPYTNDF